MYICRQNCLTKMSNSKNNLSTEEQIKQTAKELFFGQGLFKATTQEIADAAGVNRTAINYYFRSRDNLFEIVFQEAVDQMHENNRAIVLANLPFREKLEKWIDDKLESAIKHPFLEIYIVSEMKCQPKFIQKDKGFVTTVNEILGKELKKEQAKGHIKPIDPIHFIMNVSSLVSFPTCMRPLLMNSFGMDAKEFTRIIKERKKVILDTIFI